MKYNEIYSEIASYLSKVLNRKITVEEGNRWSCLPVSGVVEVTAFETDDFCNLLWTQHELDYKPSIPVISFLHEVGHIATYDKSLEDEDYDYKEELEEENLSIAEHYYLYAGSPLEVLADNWAIDFIKNNETLVRKWNAAILKGTIEYIKFLEEEYNINIEVTNKEQVLASVIGL